MRAVPNLFPLPVLVLALVAAALPSQDAHTGLTSDWVARYHRTVRFTATPVGSTPADARFELTGLDNPPLLFASELDRARRALVHPPNDLRELARWVAFDLGQGFRRARRNVVAPAVVPFGDLHLRVQQEEPGADGWQRIECAVESQEPAAQSNNRQLHGARLLPRCPGTLRGTLVVRRRFDARRGVVEGFEAELRATAATEARADGPRFELVRHEAWRQAELVSLRGRDVDQRVADGIARARDWLLRAAADPDAGDLAYRLEREQETRTTGRLALVLLALVHAEVPASDPVLQRGFAALRKRDVRDTYSLALAILALEALHAPRNERRAILEGLQDGPRPRALPPDDKRLVQQWSERLLGNADSRVDRQKELRFHYTPHAEYDNSNTHFAALGLHAADLCGAVLPAAVFAACARHYLADQERAEGKPRPLRLVRYGADGALDPKATVAARLHAAAGWPYRKGDEPTGSMTAAGVASLTLCRAALLRRGKADRALLADIDAAIGSGFAWLSEHWTMLGNPTALRIERDWRTYHLYALERACEFNRVALFDGIDWYHEGAAWLLALQGEDGHFPGSGYEDTTAATCFGLLFLKKAALPVHTR